MPRPPRKPFADALYHATSRGNGRGTIFFSDEDHERFLSQLQDCLANYKVTRYGGISSQAVSIARKRGRSLLPAADVVRLVDAIRAGG